MPSDLRRLGWAPAWRAIFHTKTWKTVDSAGKLVMLWIICHVRHQDTDTTPAGNVDTKLDRIAKDCGMTARTVQRAIAQLVAPDVAFISTHRRQVGLRIHVVNWYAWTVGEPGGEVIEAVPDTTPASRQIRQPRRISPTIEKEGNKDQRAPAGAGDAADDPPPQPTAIRTLTDRFQALYQQQNSGAKPTWGPEPVSVLRKLMDQHGLEEVLARMDRMFTAPPRWLDPPFTVRTLRGNFDHFVATTTPPAVNGARRDGSLPPSSIMDRARDLSRRERGEA